MDNQFVVLTAWNYQLIVHIKIQTANILVVPTIAAPIQEVLDENPDLIQF